MHMKPGTIILVLCVMLVIACMFGFATQRTSAESWEYRVIDSTNSSYKGEPTLNLLGRDG